MPKVYQHRAPVFQLFQNIIGNALKYAKPGVPPEIRISAEETDSDWVISIKDNGIGIDKKYHDKVFIIFQRLHSKHEFEGTGMGLAIVKKIIESLNAKIWIESEIGEGSCFYFTLPKHKKK
jgi:light-regulated signal transduction histidine kinase (bacteriophytochrome)